MSRPLTPVEAELIDAEIVRKVRKEFVASFKTISSAVSVAIALVPVVVIFKLEDIPVTEAPEVYVRPVTRHLLVVVLYTRITLPFSEAAEIELPLPSTTSLGESPSGLKVGLALGLDPVMSTATISLSVRVEMEGL